MKVLVAIILFLGAATALTLPPVHVINGRDVRQFSDCKGLYLAGYTTNGTYTYTVNGVKTNRYCYFYTGVSRTIFLNRIDGKVSWNRNFADYVVGFGEPMHDFFGGLQNIHQRTKGGNVGLDIRFMDWNGNEKKYIYENFQVDSIFNGYKVTLGGRRWGDAVARLDNINGMTFHTPDKPDSYGQAASFSTGWWYSSNTYALPTGVFHDQNICCPTLYENGIFWGQHPTYGYKYSLKRFAMSLVEPYWLATDQLLD